MVMSKKIKRKVFRCTEEDSERLEKYKDLGYKNKSDFISVDCQVILTTFYE